MSLKRKQNHREEENERLPESADTSLWKECRALGIVTFEVGTIFWSRYLLGKYSLLEIRGTGIFLLSSLFSCIFIWVRVFAGGSETVGPAFNIGFKMNQFSYRLSCTTLGRGLVDPEGERGKLALPTSVCLTKQHCWWGFIPVAESVLWSPSQVSQVLRTPSNSNVKT